MLKLRTYLTAWEDLLAKEHKALLVSVMFGRVATEQGRRKENNTSKTL